MKLRHLIAIAAIAAALTAPSATVAASPRGIVGHVTVGPTSPIGNASRAYQATVLITGRHRSWTVRSNPAGDFTIVLPPGTYVVRGLSTGLPHAPAPLTVALKGQGIVLVSLRYDSGIR